MLRNTMPHSYRESSRFIPGSPAVKEDPNTTTKMQTAFVGKLYKMVEDPYIQTLISWSDTGTAFLVYNPTDFSKQVLPIYFKHNNWQSFVRQLNMYDFHKVNNVFHTNNFEDGQSWEFEHPDFRRGAQELLCNIKRKVPKSSSQIAAQTPVAIPKTLQETPRIATPEITNDCQAKERVIGQLTQKVNHLERNLEQIHNSYEHLLGELHLYKSTQAKSFELIARMTEMLQLLAQDDNDDWHTYRKRRFEAVNDIKYEVANLVGTHARIEPTTLSAKSYLSKEFEENCSPPTSIWSHQSNYTLRESNLHQVNAYPLRDLNRESHRLTPPYMVGIDGNNGYVASAQPMAVYPLSPRSSSGDDKASSPLFSACTNITLPSLAEMASYNDCSMPLPKQRRLA